MLNLNALLNLGADAEVKTINDRQYISFRGASTEKRGEQSDTTWVSVLCGYNENLLPYLKKGQQVFVSGKMQARIFQSQQSFGMDISVFASTLQLCGGKREEAQAAPAEVAPSPVPPATSAAPFPPVQPNAGENELPF